MNTPRPAPPDGYATWLDYHLEGPNSVHDGWRFARAELAELRKERDDLRAKSAAWLDMVYELGSAMPSFVRVTDWEWKDAEKMWRIWNALVAKLRTEKTKEPKA